MPFFPNGCRALLDGWKAGKFLSWHTAQPNANGSNAYTQNGATRLAVGTLTTSSDSNSGDATNAGRYRIRSGDWRVGASHAPVDCVGYDRRHVPRVRRARVCRDPRGR